MLDRGDGMNRFKMAATSMVLLAATSAMAQNASPEAKAYTQKLDALPWGIAPAAAITNRASLPLGPQVRALDASGTNALLKLTGNLPEDESYTVAAKNGGWFAIYSFEDVGYVKDDEKIDAVALLKTLKENQEAANSERIRQGFGALTVIGWAVPPHYDPVSHNLEYGETLGSADGENINYHMRMLGRHGVMDATLITTPQYLNQDLSEFRAANKNFAFKADEGYAAYKEGDKVSEYGLAALITGGAAAAVIKGGLLKGLLAGLAAFWKLIAVGVVAFFAAFKRFFSKLFGKGDELGPPPTAD